MQPWLHEKAGEVTRNKKSDGLSDVERVMRLNRRALNDKAQLKSFTEQYGEYALIKLAIADLPLTQSQAAAAVEEATPFVLAMNGAIFGIPELAGRPLVITNKALKHICKRHVDSYRQGLSVALADLAPYIDGIVEKMLSNVLVFKDAMHPDHYVFVLSERTASGKPITTVVDADMHTKGVEIEGIISNHGNGHVLRKVAKSIQHGLGVFVNERTGAWLEAIQDLTRPGETGLPEGILAAYVRLSEEYVTRFPDEPASRELERRLPTVSGRACVSTGPVSSWEPLARNGDDVVSVGPWLERGSFDDTRGDGER